MSERTDKRIPCPGCKGTKEVTFATATPSGYEMVSDTCQVCEGVGEVCVCPVCEGSERNCHACKGRGWVKVSEWSRMVDIGHGKIMEEHVEEQKQQEQNGNAAVAKLVAIHRMGMNAVATEWERICKASDAHAVDAGVFGRLLGGMTVSYILSMEEEMKIDKHQVFARFINGMLAYMETRKDAVGVGIVAGQSGECYSGMRIMAEPRSDKEEMN